MITQVPSIRRAAPPLPAPEPAANATRAPRRGRRWLWWILVVAALAAVPLPLAPYQQDLATRVLIFALLAMSLDLIYGYGGMISLGHAAFFGVGGYAVGLLMVDGGITNFWIGAGFAVVCAAAFAAIVGAIALRTRGIYFVLVTFALGQMVYSLAQQWSALHTSGAEAVVGISQPDVSPFYITWTSENGYYFTAVVCLAATVVLWWISRSRFGSMLRGIRENEPRMSALGYNTWLYKYIAFIAAGAFAGLAGVLFAYSSGIIAPSNVDVSQSGLVVLMIILGGTGRLYGAALGAAIVVLVQFTAEQQMPQHENLFLGILFVAAVLLLRGGLVHRVGALAGKLRKAG